MEKPVMEKQYRLIFKGEVLAGFEPTEIRLRASQRLGASPAQIERLFRGQAVTLKRGLSIDAAARYARELRLLGMRMHVELDANAPPKADLPAGHCRIVFSGELAPSASREQAMAAAAERLHANPAQISLLFSGRKTTLKKGLGEEQARRYASRLQAIGMLVAIESDAPKAPEIPSQPKPGAPASEQGDSFSQADTLVHATLMHASDSLHDAAATFPVEMDFTQTMVDNDLVATNAQQVMPDMEKTELAGEATLRAYLDDAPPIVVWSPPQPAPRLAQTAVAVPAVVAPLAAATEFVQAANVAPTGPPRICSSCGARQTHGRRCAHCGHEFPRELVAASPAALPVAVSAMSAATVLVADVHVTPEKPSRPSGILYAALAAALASLSVAAWRLMR